MAKFEYAVGWSASSNASFQSPRDPDWQEWQGSEETIEEVEAAIHEGQGSLCLGLEQALDFSGFEWWAEVREAGT